MCGLRVYRDFNLCAFFSLLPSVQPSFCFLLYSLRRFFLAGMKTDCLPTNDFLCLLRISEFLERMGCGEGEVYLAERKGKWNGLGVGEGGMRKVSGRETGRKVPKDSTPVLCPPENLH